MTLADRLRRFFPRGGSGTGGPHPAGPPQAASNETLHQPTPGGHGERSGEQPQDQSRKRYDRFQELEKRYSKEGKTLYITLDLEKGANADEIKKKYRQKALQYHPDKNLDNPEEAAEKFKDVNYAYRVLMDERKRQIYDEFGSLGVKLFEDEGEDFMRAYFFWKSKKNRAVAVLIFILTFGCCGCFGCCFCFCFCCCNFCCGKFRPDIRADNFRRDEHGGDGNNDQQPSGGPGKDGTSGEHQGGQRPAPRTHPPPHNPGSNFSSDPRPPNPGGPIPAPPPPPRTAPYPQASRVQSAPPPFARPAYAGQQFVVPPLPPPRRGRYRPPPGYPDRGYVYYPGNPRPASAPPPYVPPSSPKPFSPPRPQLAEKTNKTSTGHQHVHQGARPSVGVECKDCEPPSVVDDHASRWPSVDIKQNDANKPFLRTRVRKP